MSTPDAVPPARLFDTLAATDLLAEPTRRALQARTAAPLAPSPQLFSPDVFATLVAVIARLLPFSSEDAPPTPERIAGDIDARLAAGKGNGWRYDALPPDGEAYIQVLQELDTAAAVRYGSPSFSATPIAAQEEMLHAWKAEGERIFEEMLAEAIELFFSYPSVLDRIGYTGYVDGAARVRPGLNEREAWEPAPSAPWPPAALPPATVNAFRSMAAPGRRVLLRSSRTNEDQEYDAVVVGTGAGGAPLLARLAEAGLKVLALEAGRWFDPPREFAADEREQFKIFWPDERLSAGADPLPFGPNNSGRGVGGSTLHFTSYTPRPHRDDLRLFSEFGVGQDWPISYEELEPYLTEAEQFLGVSGPATYPWGGPRSQPYPYAALPLNAPAQLMQRGCAALGIRTAPAPNAALSAWRNQADFGPRHPCIGCGHCQTGCPIGAKGSMDVTYIPYALACGAQLRSEAFVTRIETAPADPARVTGVVYALPDGTERRARCRALFLCAGAIETPRLLLLNGLGNAYGQVGKHFLAHTGIQLWGQFDEEVRPNNGIPGGLISEDFHRPGQMASALQDTFGPTDFAGRYLLQSIGVLPGTYFSQLARGEKLTGDALEAHMLGFNQVAGINMHGECLPYEHNYLELSPETDDRGLPKPRVYFSAGENERRMEAHASRVMQAIWEAAGAKRHLWTYRRYAHTLGTCRMGLSPEDSVVTPGGRVHGSRNLYICDTSVYPSALAVNPSLMQIALSLRCADRFLAEAVRGNVPC